MARIAIGLLSSWLSCRLLFAYTPLISSVSESFTSSVGQKTNFSTSEFCSSLVGTFWYEIVWVTASQAFADSLTLGLQWDLITSLALGSWPCNSKSSSSLALESAQVVAMGSKKGSASLIFPLLRAVFISSASSTFCPMQALG